MHHSRDPIDEAGGLSLYNFVDNDPVSGWDLFGLVKVKKNNQPYTQEWQQKGVWGWTSYDGNYSIEPAKLKDQGCGPCKVTKKPEVTFNILFIVVKSGKQSWKESGIFNGIVYPNRNVYVSPAIADFSERHESRRFAAWQTAFTRFFGPRFEDAAATLTAPTCDELQKKIDELFATAWKDFDNNSPEKQQLERTLLEIGNEGISVDRWVRRNGFGNVSIAYDQSK